MPWRQQLFLPEEFRATIADDEVPYDIDIHVTVSSDGVPEVASVRLMQREGAEPITPRAFRKARLGLYVETAATLASYTSEQHDDGTVSYSPCAPRDSTPAVIEGRRSGPLSIEFLRRVATAYRAEMESPGGGKKSPREAVRRAIGRGSPATASRWIAAARGAGLLAIEQ